MRHFLCTAILLCLLSPVWGHTHVDPATGDLGSVITITGHGFGDKRGKVSLAQVDAPSGKKAKVLRPRILSYSDTAIEIKLLTGVLGLYDVTVTPAGKGATPEVAASAFALVLPTLDDTGAIEATPNATITVTGQYFGATKGLVSIGGQRAKVTAWTSTSFTCQVPGKLPSAYHDLIVRNKLGSVTQDNAIRLTGSTLGVAKTDVFSGKFGKGKFSSAKGTLETQTFTTDGLTLVTITAYNRGASQQVVLTANLDLNALPITLTLGNDEVALSYSHFAHPGEVHAKPFGNHEDETYTSEGGALQVRFFGFTGNRLSGDFTATLVNPVDDDTLSVIQGAFTVTLVTE
jgi:hypothetical protein